MWCTHMWPQPRSVTPPCPPLVLHEDHGKLRARVRPAFGADAGRCEIRRCVSDKKCVTVLYYVPHRGVRTSGKTRGGVLVCWGSLVARRRPPFWRLALFKALPACAERPFWKSIFATAYFLFPLPLSRNTMRRRNEHGAPVCVPTCTAWTCNCTVWSANLCTASWRMGRIFSIKRRHKPHNVHPTSWLRYLGAASFSSPSSPSRLHYEISPLRLGI